ncbi:threonine/homoserine efflux transporter RhtA [Aestuariispira insulae]|uniref:Threonine/homoserine efflux transporter RhtA n=2 Tax=Aestuariispira insulae TaxID=1461337 RepID=A0A3D9H696_9PROT|nr:threonine/homoserine efflux transporter RhtA [Aestuariispira insulae]
MRGIFYMLAAMAVISVQETLAKYLGQYLPVMMVLWARYLGHLILMVILLWPKHGTSLFRASRPMMQAGRSLILMIDSLLFFTGLTMIGLAEATAIFFTVPMLVVVLSIPILGERVGWRSLCATLVGFIGTLVIVRPDIGGTDMEGLGTGALFILAAAFCMATFNVTTRKLANSDPMPVTLFYTALIGAVASSLAVPFFWQMPEGTNVWLALVAIGLFGGLAHSLIIAAHKYAAATTVAPFMYSQIFWALLLGWAMFDSLPDIYAWVGGGIVILSGLYLIHRGRVDGKSPAP